LKIKIDDPNNEEISEYIKEDVNEKINKIIRSFVNAENAIRYAIFLKNSMCQDEIGEKEKVDILSF
jgi:ribosome-associated translation inhibitor RaiA